VAQHDLDDAEMKFAEAVRSSGLFAGVERARLGGSTGKWKEGRSVSEGVETDETNAAALNGLGQVCSPRQAR
jgi:hypothetical protein